MQPSDSSVQISSVDEYSHNNPGKTADKTQPVSSHQAVGVTQLPSEPAKERYG